MIVTEKNASEKWCPFSRVAYFTDESGENTSVSHNRAGGGSDIWDMAYPLASAAISIL